MPVYQRKRVAIVGGGCAGITSFWALQNSIHDVHLFEASANLGGRVKTLPFENHECRIHVDTEPSLFNKDASQNLHSLLHYIGQSVFPTTLNFSTSTGTSSVELGFDLLKEIVLDPEILCRFETWQMLFSILRFRYLAVDLLLDKKRLSLSPLNRGQDDQSSLSVDEYLANEGFSANFRDKYLIPLVSTLWGTDAGRFLPRFPIRPLVRSLFDHHLLCTPRSTPQWQQLDQPASQFMKTMAMDFPVTNVHLRSRVIELKTSANHKGRFVLTTSDNNTEYFDHIIFAVDSQEILDILRPIINADEQDVLQALGTSTHVGVLHSDPSLIPKPTSTYNYITASDVLDGPIHIPPSSKSNGPTKACLTYNINTLRYIPETIFGRIAISKDPFTPPHPTFVQGVWEYTSSPSLNARTPHAVSRLPSIQNKRGISYCLCWTGCGFWEDAVTSGLMVAVEHLGARAPFPVDRHGDGDAASAEGKKIRADLCLRDHGIRTVLRVVYVCILLAQVVLYLGLLGINRLPGRGVRRLLFGEKIL